MSTIQSRIMIRITKQLGGDGAVVTPKDFLDLASRDAVDQSLTRLSKQGDLKRVGRGLYHKPRFNHKLGISVPPDADSVANAIGRQTGDRVVPSSAVIANRLGISTQIPAKPAYLTTGRSRNIQVGSQTFRFKRVSANRLPNTDTAVGRALQAIDAVGPDPDQGTLSLIRSTLTIKQRDALLSQARYSVSWIADSARKIATPDDSTGFLSHG